MQFRSSLRPARALKAVLAAAVLTAGFTAAGSASVNAAPLPVTCTGAGTVTVSSGNPLSSWSLNGAGSCQGDMEGTYIMSLAGGGTSDGLGLCGDSGTVTNLNLTVTAVLTNAATGVPKTKLMKWTAPATTFPIATPFTVEQGSPVSPTGSGLFFTRIFAKCPTLGSPVASYYFTAQ